MLFLPKLVKKNFRLFEIWIGDPIHIHGGPKKVYDVI